MPAVSTSRTDTPRQRPDFPASVDLFNPAAPRSTTFALRYLGGLATARGDSAASIAALEEALVLAQGARSLGFTDALMSDLGEVLCCTRGLRSEPAHLAPSFACHRKRQSGSLPASPIARRTRAHRMARRRMLSKPATLAEEALEVTRSFHDHSSAGELLALHRFHLHRRGDLEARDDGAPNGLRWHTSSRNRAARLLRSKVWPKWRCRRTTGCQAARFLARPRMRSDSSRAGGGPGIRGRSAGPVSAACSTYRESRRGTTPLSTPGARSPTAPPTRNVSSRWRSPRCLRSGVSSPDRHRATSGELCQRTP